MVRNFSSLGALFIALTASAPAQSGKPIRLMVDLTDAPRKILHRQLWIPVQPGPLTLVYPKWIPGEHSPTGPVDNFVGLTITAAGEPLAWQRDDVNMFAFHLTIPGGVNSIEAKADFLATAGPTGFSAGASTSANLCLLSWNELIVYPATEFVSNVMVEPSVRLPDQWKAGTALTQATVDGSTIHFSPVPLDMLIDSPVLAGRFFKEIPLAENVRPKHFLDMAGDGPEDLKAGDDVLKAFGQLITQADRLYKSHHYTSYHFLLTLSDSVAHFGLEHHQSSDDRVGARTFLDDDLKLLSGDLLPHEFTHSWNGKYRRPLGLATPNYQQPMKGELLWVYEGLTQYLGDVLATRSGIWTTDQYRSYLARSAAELDHRPGRAWRDLQDTATAAQTLYDTSEQWDNLRRSVDYYPEGELIWLEVDTTIRKLSSGRKSLDDFCARFFGPAGNTGPSLVPYTFGDVVSALKATQDYDWAKFLNERLTSKAPRAPLGGILNGGYRLEYTGSPNEFDRAMESSDHGLDAWYSLGFHDADNTIEDVLFGSPAYKAGLGPGMKIVAVNGRRASEELLRDAIRDTKGNAQSIDLIVENTGFFKIVKIEYHEGEKYPHLVRVAQTPALLDEILKPLGGPPQTTKAD